MNEKTKKKSFSQTFKNNIACITDSGLSKAYQQQQKKTR